MKKTFELLSQEFESSSTRTPQYLTFHKTFRREFRKLLSEHILAIKVHEPNHFDISGFFQLANQQIYYFSISDLRWSKDKMLVRKADSFTDYTGKSNNFISLSRGKEEFVRELFNYLNIVPITLD